MKRQILAGLVALAVVVAITSIAQALPDDGHLRGFHQPDSSMFLGRGFGDEFLHRFETEDGYTFVKSYSDGWYYYAQQDGQGDLVPTEWRVGTVDPAEKGIPQHLDYGEAKKQEAEAIRDSVNAERVPEPIYGPRSLAVILIEFPDQGHYICHPPQSDPHPFSLDDFSNLFFSDEVYLDYAPRCDEERTEQPDLVFGSMNDYWQEVSYGNIWLVGDILNHDDGNGNPVWYVADHSRDYYDGRGMAGAEELLGEALAKAQAAGFTPSDYRHHCLLYAGDWDQRDGLWPHSGPDGYWMGEMQDVGGELYFNHIGPHCHEFGHQLGLPDSYGGAGGWCVMDGGWSLSDRWDHRQNKEGGACPAHLSPFFKWKLGWLEPTFVDTILPNQVFYPVETHPQVYCYTVRSNEYFLLEYRTIHSGSHFDQSIYPADDPSTDGLLIWHIVQDSDHSYLWYQTVERADLSSGPDPEGDLWPGTTGKDAFTPVSAPNTGGFPTYVEGDSLGRDRQTLATGFSIEGITLHSDPLYITADLYDNKWAGDIVSPREWSGLQYVVGDVNICNGSELTNTLTISPGSNILFSHWTALSLVQGNPPRVRSALIAEGKEDSMITFTSAAQYPDDGDWDGIIFYKGRIDNSSVLKYCDISYSTYGITCLGSSPSISFCNSHNNREGIICYDSSFSHIDSCTVYDNLHWGIWCGNGSVPVIHRCSIYGNGDYGLLNDDSTVTVVADSNWWGDDSTGPYDPSPGPPDYNPDGKGDKVSDYVIYRPWRKYGGVGIDETKSEKTLPDHFSLSQNHPNPFNPTTQIKYALPKDCWVRLEVFNILGQRVGNLVDGRQKAGYKTVRWDASRVASGVYIYRLQAKGFVETKRMVLLR